MIQLFWNTTWHVLKNINTVLLHHLVSPLLEKLKLKRTQKHTPTDVHSRIVYVAEEAETLQMSIGR